MKKLSLLVLSFLLLTTIKADDHSNSISGKKYLEQTSKAFSQISKKAIPAVVFIKTQNEDNSYQEDSEEDSLDLFGDDLFKKFFGQQSPRQKKRSQPITPSGSGFIISTDGYIITNYHVIKNAKKLIVILNNGVEYEGKIIGSDPRTDIAIVKIEAKDLSFLEFGNSNDLEIGEWAIAIGNPFALQASVTVGIVSAKQRNNLHINDFEDFIQTDAAINPGNSGGPLLDLEGKVIGMNTAITSLTGGYMGIGFAIPSNMIKRIYDQLMENGNVQRGYIGIQFQDINEEMAEALSLKKSQGILITEITPNSPAEKAGLQQGDILIEYNDIPIKNGNSFRNEIAMFEPGSILNLKIMRKGKLKNIKITLELSPQDQLTPKKFTELGIDVSELKTVSPDILRKFRYDQNTKGLIVMSVKPRSLGALSGIRPGMLILEVDQKPVKTITDFYDNLQKASEKRYIALLVEYQGIKRFITIKVK